MELRKDPITRSWVITGDDVPETPPSSGGPCRFCPDPATNVQCIANIPPVQGGPWSACAVVHPTPLYRVEGDPSRRGDGIYDRMRPIGAHEVLLENPHHDVQLWNASDAEIESLLLLMAQRIQDLKRDMRLKYVTVFKNYGIAAGQEFDHPNSQLTATTFVPRRVLYELRSGREYFKQKERCVFCDIVAQELQQKLRLVEIGSDFVAMCPYAPRVPYETWILPLTHESTFERFALNRSSTMRELGALLRRTLRRIRTVTEQFHLVLHTTPNTYHQSKSLGYWKTIDEDYHWHIEIMPMLAAKAKSYSFKEVYYSPLSSETAAKRLREATS